MQTGDEKKPPLGGFDLLTDWLSVCVDAGLLASPTAHDWVLHELAKVGVVFGADVHQVNAAAPAAPVPLGVVLGKAAKLVGKLGRLQLHFFKVRLKHRVLCFQVFYMRGHHGQVLAQRRRAAARIDHFHGRVKHRLDHLWALCWRTGLVIFQRPSS